MNLFRTSVELDLEKTIGSLAAENERLKYQRDEARRDRDAFCEEVAERTAERDRARATAVALEQDGAMAHKALMILAEAVLNEVNPNAAVYSKALAVKQIGGTA